MGKMQKDQDVERAKITQMEVQIGNILEKLKEYEQELRHLIRESGIKMEQITSSLCVAAASLGKKSNEEIMSFGNTAMGSPGGPSKRTRQSTRKKVAEALGVPMPLLADIIQNTVEVGKEVASIIKELLQLRAVDRVCWFLVRVVLLIFSFSFLFKTIGSRSL